jgi:3-oxoacyl-[acyl-carrier protein] reductase
MDLGLKGLNVLVTGGTKGIGRRTADIFVDEGANVSICARNAKEVEEAVADFKKRGAKSFGQGIDVGKKTEIEGWVEASAKALGGIDIVVANVSALAAAEDSEASWDATYNVDMMHTVRSVNSAMPYLEKSKHASIVVVSSVSGREVDFTSPAYGAIKSALIHYAQGLAFKLAPKNIRVNSVSPGNTYFKGGVWNYIEENVPDLFKASLAMNPTGRMAKPEEIGRGIVFLASPASSFTMGTNLVIDGALTKGVQY